MQYLTWKLRVWLPTLTTEALPKLPGRKRERKRLKISERDGKRSKGFSIFTSFRVHLNIIKVLGVLDETLFWL